MRKDLYETYHSDMGERPGMSRRILRCCLPCVLWSLRFITSDKARIERQLIEPAGIPYHPIPAGKLRRYADENVRDIFWFALVF